MQKKITFDYNCIISIENNEYTSNNLKKLLFLHDNGIVNIFVPAISGNEKLPGGKYSNSLTQFVNRINLLSKKPIDIIHSLTYFDMCFYDHCRFPSEEMINLDHNIHKILYPNEPICLQEYIQKMNLPKDEFSKVWMNHRCDVISLWCHIFHKNDIFVTNDKNFFKKTKIKKLYELGANKILKPNEVLALLGY